MSSIFISHSSHDNGWAEQIRDWLLDGREQRPQEQRFRSLFLDFDPVDGIQAGERWRDQLYEHLRLCAAVIVLCSEAYAASQWCLAELGVAMASGKLVLPVRIASGTPLPKLLSETQATALAVIDLEQGAASGWQRLLKGLEPLSWQSRLPWPPPGEPGASPFPGLNTFERRHAAVFFGQDQVLRTLRERINQLPQRQSQLLLILGASGCGKSSLLRAGVLPWLAEADRRSWIVLEPFRPGKQPFKWLHQVVSERFKAVGAIPPGAPARTVEQLGDQLEDLRRLSGQQDARVVIPIDQLEELLGRGDDLNPKLAADADAFLSLLAQLLAMEGSQVLILATLRSDFYGQLQLHPSGLHRLAGPPQPLGPMEPAGFRQVIEGPAQRVGLRLEPGLSDALVHDTTTGDALPLLAFTLQELWEGRGNGLTLQQYEAFGRLEGAVQRKADAVIKKLGPDEASLKALRAAFVPAMVRVGEKGVYARRAAAWDSLPEAARPLLKALVAARLLVRRQEEGQPSTVEVAHEAVLRVWPELRDWLDDPDTRVFLLGSQQLEQDLEQWKGASRADKPKALLSGLKLARGLDWLAKRSDQLRPELRGFILASQQRAVRQRRILLGSAAAAFAVISGAAGLAFLQLQRARAAQAAQFEATHRALITSDPFLSVVYGLAATKPLLDGNNPWEAAQLSQTLQDAVMANMARSAPIATGQGEVSSLIERSNGELISGGRDGSLRRWWDGHTAGGGQPIATGQGEVLSLIELKNGELISGGSNGSLRRWVWVDGKPVGNGQPITTGQGEVLSLIELKNGELISGGQDGTLRRWVWVDGKLVGGGKPIATGQKGGLWRLVELKDGELISGGGDGSLKLWPNHKAVGEGELIANGKGVISLIELKNGELITGGYDGSLRRWVWVDGKAVGKGQPIPTGQWQVLSLIALRNGELISGGYNGLLRRWRDGKPVGDGSPISTDQGRVWSLIQKKNGVLVSIGDDDSLRSWTPAPIARAACRQIDLASIPTDRGLGPVVEAARATCRELGVRN